MERNMEQKPERKINRCRHQKDVNEAVNQEDTDAERSSAEMVTGILDGMGWLGLDWDEGPGVGGPHAPYFQSQRYDRHRGAAASLVAAGRAYYCYCSAERLREERERAEARGEAWQYDRRCLNLPHERVAELEAAHTPRAIRFNVPAGVTLNRCGLVRW